MVVVEPTHARRPHTIVANMLDDLTGVPRIKDVNFTVLARYNNFLAIRGPSSGSYLVLSMS